MSTWYEDVEQALRDLGGAAHLSSIYERVRVIRSEPHPPSFEAIIRRELESNSSDSESFQGKRDIFESVDGIGSGVWGLRGYISEGTGEPVAFDFDISLPNRTEFVGLRIIRDTAVTRRLKLLHRDQCQLCNLVLDLGHRTYSEAHHIRPLGNGHDGPDIAANILVVCPNCHVLLDYGSIELDLSHLSTHEEHVVSQEYIDYHNSQIRFG